MEHLIAVVIVSWFSLFFSIFCFPFFKCPNHRSCYQVENFPLPFLGVAVPDNSILQQSPPICSSRVDLAESRLAVFYNYSGATMLICSTSMDKTGIFTSQCWLWATIYDQVGRTLKNSGESVSRCSFNSHADLHLEPINLTIYYSLVITPRRCYIVCPSILKRC